MAIVAEIVGVDMRGALAGRGRAVMAADTGYGDAGVIKADVTPDRRRVAIVTIVRALQMRWRLALGHDIVVAAPAGADYGGVIHPRGGREVPERVARFAVVQRADVIDRLGFGVDQPTALMALDTAARCPSENAVHVAALAGHAGMAVFEREAGREMVEVPRLFRRVRRSRREGQQRENEGREDQAKDVAKGEPSGHRRILTFLKLSVWWHCSQRRPNSPECSSSLAWQA